MKNILIGIIAITLLVGCTGNVNKTAEPMKKYPAFDIQNMDTTIKPGDDFFDYADGKWMKNNPIPADKNSKDAFDELFERNRENIREIITDAATAKEVVPGSNKQKIGTFYKSGMDTTKIAEQGIKPLKSFFDKIDAIKTINDVQMTAAFFQSYSISPLFGLSSNQDSK